ncbi:uncharacterized protein METZ01_LOCUS317777 [marine metagenome]|uniref:Uncharacterized protein n=1 Tax=marine metagenome TaxID=408172 RepID=A0A382NUQ9_9ZZZZ
MREQGIVFMVISGITPKTQINLANMSGNYDNMSEIHAKRPTTQHK